MVIPHLRAQCCCSDCIHRSQKPGCRRYVSRRLARCLVPPTVLGPCWQSGCCRFSATALIASLPRAGLRRPSRQTPVHFLRGQLNSRASAISCPRLASHASPPSPLKAPFKSQGWLTTPLTPAWKALPNICKPYAFLKDPLKGCLLCETLMALGKKHSPVSWPPALSLSLS